MHCQGLPDLEPLASPSCLFGDAFAFALTLNHSGPFVSSLPSPLQHLAYCWCFLGTKGLETSMDLGAADPYHRNLAVGCLHPVFAKVVSLDLQPCCLNVAGHWFDRDFHHPNSMGRNPQARGRGLGFLSVLSLDLHRLRVLSWSARNSKTTVPIRVLGVCLFLVGWAEYNLTILHPFLFLQKS